MFSTVHLGSFEIRWTEVTYQKAKGICGSAQHKMEDVIVDVTRLQNDFKKPTAFWVPEVIMDSTRGISLSKVCLTNILNQWMLFDRIFNLKRTFLTTMIVSMRCITKGWIKQSNKAIEFFKLKNLLKYELLIS